MKRRLIIGLAAATLMLFGSALAVPDDQPTDPNFTCVQEFVESIHHPMLSATNNDLFTFEAENDFAFTVNEPMQWTMTYKGSVSKLECYIMQKDSNTLYGTDSYTVRAHWSVNTVQQDDMSSGTFTFTFLEPGSYTIYCYADGNTRGRKIVTVSGTAENTCATVIDRLVSECEAACDEDYEKVYWCHDWLLKNVTYDSTYTYYSEEGAFLRGTCVCQGYSLALEKLLNEMDITVACVTSKTKKHAWNIVQLNGKYYELDATWDDSITYDDHTFLCVTNEMMVASGHGMDTEYMGKAVSLDDNWYIRNGCVDEWMNTAAAQEMVASITEKFETHQNGFEMSLPTSWYGLTSKALPKGFVNALLVEKLKPTLVGYETLLTDQGSCLSWNCVYACSENCLTAVNAPKIVDADMLLLPSALTEIGNNAFENDNTLLGVRVSETVTSIGSGAFMNCTGLKLVELPENVEIADDAFFGCNCFLSGGETVRAYAESHGLNYVEK